MIVSLFNLSNIIKEPTRVVGNSKTLIDPVIVSDACSVLDSGTITVEPFISDHKATYVSIKSSVSFTNSYYREVWNYKHADFEKLNNLISQYCWDSVINDSTSVDQASLNFTNSYIDLCKTCIPRKRVLIRPSDKPWFSSELRYNIRLRDRLRQKALKTNLVNDKLIFKKQRNRVNNMKKYAKENYINNFEDTILSSENSTKTFWQIMSRFMGKQAITNSIPPLYTSNNNYVLNDYFCSISTIDDSGTSLPIFNERTNFSLSNLIINVTDVTDVLSSLKVNKAVGPDGISHRMLKNTFRTISVPLLKLFNLSLHSHSYPHIWKVAHVMPVFKKGDRSLVSNYRPISLVSCVGKVFEIIIFKNVYNYLVDNSLIYKYQSGFLPGHSTVHHLIEVIHHTCLALENYEINCQVFCDISKAFDRVWHKGLIYKLEKYGIKDNLLLWFKDYLENRSQKVFVNEVVSLHKHTSAGVPQGSVLGPLLFLIFINDISDDLNGMARLFADDTSLSYSSANLDDIKHVLNDDLSKLSAWAKKWLITFNPQKTEVMLISNTFIDQNFELVMDDTALEIVDIHKHLGVILSSNNRWTTHIDSIIKSASKQISYLRKLKYQFPKSTLNKLYCTYIRPLLEYASEVWDGSTLADSVRLETVQLNAARIVTGLPLFSSQNSLYYETGWEALADRRKNRKLTLMYRIVNADAPAYLTDLMPNRVSDMSNYNLRNNQDFNIPFTRLCSFETSSFPSTLKLWNDLDPQIRCSPSLLQFKRAITHKRKATCFLIRGDRSTEIALTRIRHNCSILNADLYRVNIIASPNCICGPFIETAEHYFFECSLYALQRNSLFSGLPQFFSPRSRFVNQWK